MSLQRLKMENLQFAVVKCVMGLDFLHQMVKSMGRYGGTTLFVDSAVKLDNDFKR